MNVAEVRLPHNLDAERAVLGAVLARPDAMLDLADVRDEDFFRASHQALWREFRAMSGTAQPIDFVTLCASLRASGRLSDAGGESEIAQLVDGRFSTRHVGAYAERLRGLAQLRQVIRTCLDAAALAETATEDAAAILQQIESDVLAISQSTTRSELLPASELIDDVQRKLEALSENRTGVIGVPTGLTDLDHMTRGLQGLAIVAGRPSMGKSALAAGIACHVARTVGPVAFFSLEMSRDELLLREVIGRARVNGNRVIGGHLSQTDYQSLSDALESVRQTPVYIDDGGDRTAFDIRSRCRRMKSRVGLSLVVVDYLQLLSTVRREDRRDLEVSAMTRAFKQLSKELAVPIVVLSQLNRRVEGSGEKRPTLSDLRESGAIEQDADMVIACYRDEYYRADSPDRGVAELLILKARNGPTGTVRVGFIPEQTRFTNLEERR